MSFYGPKRTRKTVQECYQTTTLKPTQSSCPSEKLLEHFKAHFNPSDSSQNVPEEFDEPLPDFVTALQNISNDIAINHQSPTIDEIQLHLRKLKVKKASNDIDPELLKRCKQPIMLQVIHQMTTNL
jgi:hypothetical protein